MKSLKMMTTQQKTRDIKYLARIAGEFETRALEYFNRNGPNSELMNFFRHDIETDAHYLGSYFSGGSQDSKNVLLRADTVAKITLGLLPSEGIKALIPLEMKESADIANQLRQKSETGQDYQHLAALCELH